ncbi:TetR/AcrR family transcriptional regulator [Kitasatospora sp. RG8]|uniref:TetR/AcrR family transcriptional regulator n=1 Tax=Kitasatospora sp. RG8 TaxID=2820815 RepID=UPI0027DBCEB7|nr:TetR/AcrR family transcriptional regulator [Kitasatospora sp. RG8]
MERSETAAPVTDGRTERGRQTREKIADAMLSLLDENQAHFPADKVAERAGVSRRLVFHHFADMAQLAEVAVGRRLEQLMAQVRPLPTEGPRDVRVAALTEQRARILEGLTPARLAIMRLENPSPRVHEAVQQMLEFARLRLGQIFALELDPLSEPGRTDLLNGLDAVTTWSTWHHWRSTGLSPEQARHTMAVTVHALLASADHQADDRPAEDGPADDPTG